MIFADNLLYRLHKSILHYKLDGAFLKSGRATSRVLSFLAILNGRARGKHMRNASTRSLLAHIYTPRSIFTNVAIGFKFYCLGDKAF